MKIERHRAHEDAEKVPVWAVVPSVSARLQIVGPTVISRALAPAL
jgi:hypothetical protein